MKPLKLCQGSGSFASYQRQLTGICVGMEAPLVFFLHVSLLGFRNSSSINLYNTTSLQTTNYKQQHQLQHQQQQNHQLHQRRQQHFLLSGNVHSHPGPSSDKKTRKVAHLCVVCTRGVTKACKAVSSDFCKRWTQVKCSVSVSLAKHNECVRHRARTFKQFPFTQLYWLLRFFFHSFD